MKILHVTNYFMEGFGYQENWLPFCQSDLGHSVKLATSDRWFPLPSYEELFEDKYGPRVRDAGTFVDRGVEIVKKKPFLEIASRAQCIFPIARTINDFEPNVIHVHGATNLNLPTVLRNAPSSARIFVDCHQDKLVTRHTSIPNKLFYAAWSRYYKMKSPRISQFLPISKGSSDFLEEKLGINTEQITFNYLGVDPGSKHFSDAKSREFRRQNGLGESIVMINAGKQYEDKNILFIIALYRELLGLCQETELSLVLIGEATGVYEQKISQEIRAVNASDPRSHIVRLPFLPNDELAAAYSAADVGIWPGVASNTIQEAMACQVVVALLDTGVTSHLVVEDALLVKNLNPVEVANQLVAVINDSDELARLKAKTLTLIQKYSWQKIAEDSIRIYLSKN